MTSSTNRLAQLILALAAALVLTTVVSACSKDKTAIPVEDDAGQPSSVVTTTWPDRPADAEFISVSDLDDGDCFDVQSDSRSLTRAVWRFSCSQPHDYEVYSSFEFEVETPVTKGLYPGAGVVQDQAERRCYEGFEEFVGIRWAVSDLDIRTWWPSETSWNKRDRSILCAVTSTDRSRLTGSQRGSRR